MKLVMTTPIADESDGRVKELAQSALAFDELRQGVHQARCRFDYVPAGGPSNPSLTLSRIVNLTITSEASDNAKGRRRVLVKVDLPYARFANLDPSNPSRVDKLPTNFGDVSAHLVLSIPSGMKSDCESTDYISRVSAEASIQLVLSTLLSLLGANVGASRAFLGPDVINQYANYSIGIAEFNKLIEDGSNVHGAAYTVQTTGGASPRLTSPEVSSESDPLTGLPIVTIRSTDRLGGEGGTNVSGRGILGDAKSPLARGLSGLVPIEENATICVPVEYYTDFRPE